MKTELDQINDEACRWVARLHTGKLSPSEEDALQQWMRQSELHEAELRRMAKRWDELNILTELAVSEEVPRLRSVGANLLRAIQIQCWQWGSAVAALGLVLTLMVLAPQWSQWGREHPSVYRTDVGEQRKITLSDQSVITLNTHSRVRVDFTKDARNVYLLQGEAYFSVARDSDRVFRVYAEKSQVRAIGTAFTVHLKEAAVEIIVAEGAVEFDAQRGRSEARIDAAPPVVRAGQSAIFDKISANVEVAEAVSEEEISKKISWHTGVLQFSGDTLEDAIREVSRYTPLSIVILDPELRQLRIGGLFRVGETAKMLRVLESNFGVRVVRVNEHVVHLSSAKATKSED